MISERWKLSLASDLDRPRSPREPEGIASRSVTRPSRAPVSVLQEHLWYLAQLAPGNPVYSEAVVINKHGPLDVVAFQAVYLEMLRRHQIWRSTFELDGDRPVQVVHPVSQLPIEVIDLADMEREEAVEEATRLAAQNAAQPYNLGCGPLIRPLIVRLAAERYQIHVAFHHLIFDAVSLYRIALPEMIALYDAFAAGRSPELPEPELQYADYAVWSHAWVAGEEYARRMQYWRERLSGVAPLELPLDHPRPREQRFRGAMVPFEVDGALAGSLREMSRAGGMTLFQALAAAFAVFLHQHSGQDDIALGTMVDMRRGRDMRRMIGYCLTPVVLRIDLSGDPRWADVMVRCREQLRSALHRAVPFERLVREIAPYRDAAMNPLVQAMIVLQPPMPSVDPAWRESQLDVEVARRLGTAKFDLHIQLEERPEGRVRGQLIYNTDLFEHETACRFAARWLTLLRQIAADPDRCISSLSVLTSSERKQLAAWNSTMVPLRDGRIEDLVAEQAARTPAAVAAVHGPETITFADLEARADQLATRLWDAGARPGRLVAVAMEPSIDLIVGLLAVLKTGAAYLPLDLRYPPSRLEWMLHDSRSHIVLMRASGLAQLPDVGLRVVYCDGDGPRGAARTTSSASSWGAGNLTGDDLAYVIYTSGSTGQPKAVMIRHRSVVNLLSALSRDLCTGAGDVVVAHTAVSFDIAVLEIWLPLITGARMAIASRETAADGRLLAELVRSSNATLLQATPSTWRMLIEAGWAGNPELIALSGGEGLSRELADDLQPRVAALWNMYGPTETTVWSTWGVVEPGEGITVGRPASNTRVYVLDRGGAPLPIGVPGELYIGGEGVAAGYLHRPELTQERFLPDPFFRGGRMYRTGDRVRLLFDGRIQFLGRLDDQLKLHGIRVEPAEIESALATHPGVAAAAVVADDRGDGDVRLVAYVARRSNADPLPDELRGHLRRLLPDYMVPAVYSILDRLPVTTSGKIDRAGLLAVARVQREAGPQPCPPRNVLEMRLADIWAELLALESVGVDDDFFELGGHSLLAMRLLVEVERRLGVALPLDTLVGSAPATVRQMAARIAASAPPHHRGGEVSVVPISDRGSGAVLFFAYPSEESLVSLRHITAALPAQQRIAALVPLPTGGRFDLSQSLTEMARSVLGPLRLHQPEGPYLIGGYSFGGMLAYAIAAELRAAGESVAWLGLIDTLPPPGVRRYLRHVARQQRRARLGRAMKLINRRAAREIVSVFLRRAHSVATRARQGRPHLRPLTEDGYDWYGALRLAARYSAHGHDAPLELFITTASVTATGSPSLWWDETHHGPLTVHQIPGDHSSALREPLVRVLATELARSVPRANEAAS